MVALRIGLRERSALWPDSKGVDLPGAGTRTSSLAATGGGLAEGGGDGYVLGRLGNTALVLGQTVGVSRFEQKTTVVHREPVATDGVGLVLDFHLKVAQNEGFLGDPDDLENLGWKDAVVEVVGTPELEGDHLLTALGTAAVDVMFAGLSDFRDVKVRGDVRSVGKDEDDLLEVSEGLLEFLQVHG